MFRKKYIEVTEKKEVICSCICDECGMEHIGNDYPDNWHLFSAQHYEWGNDSFESKVEYLVCSPECYVKQLNKAVHEFEYKQTAEIDEMTIDFAKRMIKYFNKKNT